MKQYHNNLYDPTQKEVYKILGSYGIDKPKSNMVIELCNLIIDHVEQAYESGFTNANNEWAFKVDARLKKALMQDTVICEECSQPLSDKCKKANCTYTGN